MNSLLNKGIEQKEVNSQKNVILMIGDGMGNQHIRLSRLVDVGNEGKLALEQLPYRFNVTTYSSDSSITDSAAAATAIATGTKVNNDNIAMDKDGHSLTTILEIAQSLGKSVGVITTDILVGATPASFVSHVIDRGDYDGMIADILANTNITFIMGGGLIYFNTAQQATIISNNYTLVTDKAQFDNITVGTGKVFGLLSTSSLPSAKVYNISITPSLEQMTAKAIDILSQDPDGFFLMVEASLIDPGGHNNDPDGIALETIEFDHAVNFSHHYAINDPNNTLLIVASDHETGGLSVGNYSLNADVPTFGKTYEENRSIRLSRVANITCSFSTTDHSAINVPFYGYGTFLENINKSVTIFDNTYIFEIMNSFIQGTNLPEPPPLPPSTTTTLPPLSTITSSNGKISPSFNECMTWFVLCSLGIYRKNLKQKRL